MENIGDLSSYIKVTFQKFPGKLEIDLNVFGKVFFKKFYECTGNYSCHFSFIVYIIHLKKTSAFFISATRRHLLYRSDKVF